jgi:PAS domain-containing protein
MITENSLPAFFEAMPIGIWRQGVDNKFAWANPAFCRIAGCTMVELRAMATLEMIKPSWRKSIES